MTQKMPLARKHIFNVAPYEAGKPIKEVQRELGLKKVIKLASNENPLGPSPAATRAMRREAANTHLYPEGSCYELRQALSKKLKVKPECLFFGNGSNELLVLIAMTFLNPGDEVVFSEESFVLYKTMAALMQAEARVAPAKGHAHDLNAFIKLISSKTKLVFICCPNNPTGTMVTKEEVADFMKQVPMTCLVVFDQAYAEFAKGADCGWGEQYLSGVKPVLVLKTFSKFYGLAGLRVGYGIAREDIVQAIEHVRQPFNVDHLAQSAALAALTDKPFHRRVSRNNEEGKRFFYRELDKLGFEYVKTQANFIYMQVPLDCRQVFDRLLRKGVIIRPVMGHYIRVTIGTQGENKEFFKRLKEVI